MDKTNRALIGVEDNTEWLNRLTRRMTTAVASGNASGGATVFGKVKADGAAIVAFDGGSCALTLDGKQIASGTSPLFAKLNGGGELKLNAARSDARCLIFGGTFIE